MRSVSSVCAACIVAGLFGSATAAVQDVDEQALAAAREGLLPIPLPPLGAVEQAVARQIEDGVRSVRDNADGGRELLAQAYGDLAQALHAYEFLDAAAAGYESARRLAQRDYRWPHLLGALREQAGAFEEAVDLYLEAIRLEPDDHVARIRLANVFLQLDRRGEARAQFDAQRDRFPASSLAGLGEIALREGRFQDAIRLLEDALRRAPQATGLHYSIGMAYRGLGRIDDARVHLERSGRERVRAADPLVDALPALLRGYRAPLNQARVELQGGAYDAAAAMFRRALAAAPDSVEARTGLAAALERLGDREGARAELALGNEGATLELAIRLADEQRFGEAIALLTAAHGHFPERDATATTLARLLAASPDIPRRNGARALEIAIQVYERRATPAHGETVALALAELGRCVEAEQWMRDAVARAEKDGDDEEAVRLGREILKYQKEGCRKL